MLPTFLLLSALTPVLAQFTFPPAIVVVERAVGCGRYENTTVEVYIEDDDYADPEVLSQVSTLYQIATTNMCIAYMPDGTTPYNNADYFTIGKPLHLSRGNVVVSRINCNVE
ncbi:hypothetical protein GGS20DRAFT_28368 [Poronia punctata]|nr:hypothetical protein GGS20DRAFT_28368 [Poronia punctata]